MVVNLVHTQNSILKTLLRFRYVTYRVYTSLKYYLMDRNISLLKYSKQNYYTNLLNGGHFLSIESSSICNAKCVFCAYKIVSTNPNYTKSNMSFELFKKSLDQYSKIGGKRVLFSPTLGDSLCDPDIFKKIKYSKQEGFHVSLFTNGLLFSKRNYYEDIVNSGVDELNISIGDFNPNFDSKIFGISKKASSTRILSLLNLLKYVNSNKSNIRIIFHLRSNRSYEDILLNLRSTQLYTFYKNKVFTISYSGEFDSWGGMINSKDLLNKMHIRVTSLKRRLCMRLSNFIIYPNGDVRLCGCRINSSKKDDLVIGNIHTNNLKNILSSKKVLKIFSDFEIGKLPVLCRKCTMYDAFRMI